MTRLPLAALAIAVGIWLAGCGHSSDGVARSSPEGTETAGQGGGVLVRVTRPTVERVTHSLTAVGSFLAGSARRWRVGSPRFWWTKDIPWSEVR
jgi:hypothetical protein